MNQEKEIVVEDAIPGPEEYCRLRIDCGLSPMSPEAASAGLPRSLYAVTLREKERLVGMGRVVGDGLHTQVVDIAVHPGFQKRGLSRLIMDRVMGFIREKIPECAVVSLFADVDWLYQKYGFGNPERSKGMFLKKPR